MRHRPGFWILLALAFLTTLSVRPAAAGLDSWYFGTGFQVGGAFFRIGFAEAGPFGSSFYFEAARPFYYPGYRCSSYCYRQGPRYYHHPSCPVVHHHFGLYGYSPGYYLEHYGPPLPYPPPVYYYAPPQWQVHFYGGYRNYAPYYREHYDRGRYGDHRYDRGRPYGYWQDRRGNDWDRRGHDDNRRRDWDRRDDRRGNDRDRRDHGRSDGDRHNRGGIDRD